MLGIGGEDGCGEEGKGCHDLGLLWEKVSVMRSMSWQVNMAL